MDCQFLPERPDRDMEETWRPGAGEEPHSICQHFYSLSAPSSLNPALLGCLLGFLMRACLLCHWPWGMNPGCSSFSSLEVKPMCGTEGSSHLIMTSSQALGVLCKSHDFVISCILKGYLLTRLSLLTWEIHKGPRSSRTRAEGQNRFSLLRHNVSPLHLQISG